MADIEVRECDDGIAELLVKGEVVDMIAVADEDHFTMEKTAESIARALGMTFWSSFWAKEDDPKPDIPATGDGE